MPSSTKSASRTKSSKAQKGSVGFIHAGTFRQGLFRVFKSDDKDPAEALNELHEYYGTKLSGRYVNVENVDELYEKLVESYQDNLVKGTTNVFKTSTMKSVSDNLKKLGEVSKCHLIKGGDDEEREELEHDEHEEDEEPEEKVSKGKGSKGKQIAKKAETEDEDEDEDEKPVKSKQAKSKPTPKKVVKEESENEESEQESEDEKPVKKSKGKTTSKHDDKNDDSEDEGEKLKKKSSPSKKSSSSAKKTK